MTNKVYCYSADTCICRGEVLYTSLGGSPDSLEVAFRGWRLIAGDYVEMIKTEAFPTPLEVVSPLLL